MKVKLKAFLHTDKQTAAMSGARFSFSLFGQPMTYEGSTYTVLAEEYITFEFDEEEAIAKQLADIEEQGQRIRAETQRRLDTLEALRSRLVALSAPKVAPGVELLPRENTAPKDEKKILATEDAKQAKTGWQQFFVTYGNGTVRANKYSVVWAANQYEAREYVFSVANRFWSSIYTWDEFQEKASRFYFGDDCIIPVGPHNG